MERTVTARELEEKAAYMNKRFGRGEQILFCVDWATWLCNNIHSDLFSTAEKALAYAQSFNEKDFVSVYPVFDIWNNPKQVDCRLRRKLT